MARIDPAPAKDPFRRYVRRATRKRFGRDLESTGITAHHAPMLAGMGAFEIALERSRKVDARLKALAEVKAALMVGCEFCIDIGSHVGAREGVTDEQLLALPRHRGHDRQQDVGPAECGQALAIVSMPLAATRLWVGPPRRRLAGGSGPW